MVVSTLNHGFLVEAVGEAHARTKVQTVITNLVIARAAGAVAVFGGRTQYVAGRWIGCADAARNTLLFWAMV